MVSMDAPTITESAEPATDTTPPTSATPQSLADRLARIAATAGMVLALLLVVAAGVFPALTGGTPMTILTGSTQPILPVGHVAVYYPAPAESLKVGDIIAYQPAGNVTNGVPITHRIVEIESAEGHVCQIVVKGDANRFADRPVDPGQVIGKMAYYIPYAGLLRVASFSLGLGWLQTLVSAGLMTWAAVLLVADARKRRARN